MVHIIIKQGTYTDDSYMKWNWDVEGKILRPLKLRVSQPLPRIPFVLAHEIGHLHTTDRTRTSSDSLLTEEMAAWLWAFRKRSSRRFITHAAIALTSHVLHNSIKSRDRTTRRTRRSIYNLLSAGCDRLGVPKYR